MFGKILSFDDPRRAEITSYPLWKCWIFVVPSTFASIVIGWLLVIFSCILNFEVASSGSLLVCAAVIAEVLYERSRFRRWPRIEHHGYYGFALTESGLDGLSLSGEKIHISGKTKNFGGPVRSLLGLSRDSEWRMSGNVNGRDIDGTFWNYSDAIQRVENTLTWIILGSAVIGTLIWGYYDYFFQV